MSRRVRLNFKRLLGGRKMKPIFNKIDFNIIKVAKQTQIKIKDVKENLLILDVDDLELLIRKDDRGYLVIDCPCEFCGKKGIASNILCRRKIRVIWFLIQNNGKISEVDIDRGILKKKYPIAFKDVTTK